MKGFRDPLATDPNGFLNCEPTSYGSSCHIDPVDVESTWEPYIAPVPELTLKRAYTLLQPPDDITLRVEPETLYIAGIAPVEWLIQVLKLAPALPGITTVELEEKGPSINELTESIEATRLTFAQGASNLDGNQDEIILALIRNMHLLHREATLTGQHVHIEIIGFASSEGSQAANNLLSLTRAQAVQATLLEHGLQTAPTRPDGITITTSSDTVSTQETSEAEREANRKVAFQVTVE
jgi:outer membrane protein OmpA-like peptidoglycan-associated protein